MKMKKIAWIPFAVVLLICFSASPATKKGAHEAKVSITVHLGKTALWVGDTFSYTIRAIHDPDIEFALDNLKKENFALPPFVVRGITVSEEEWTSDKKLLEITLLLSPYEIGKSELTIPPISLYYFTRETGLGTKEKQAVTVQVPANHVGLRSTLGSGKPKPRDFKPTAAIDVTGIFIPFFLGLAGLGFVGVRGARWAWKNLHSPKTKRRPLRRNTRERLLQESLAKIRALGSDPGRDPSRFYQEVSQFLRRYLEESSELEALCLTPEEIEKALQLAGTNGSLAERVRSILEQCEAVRYGKDGLSLAQGRDKELLDSLEKAVVALRREPVR